MGAAASAGSGIGVMDADYQHVQDKMGIISTWSNGNIDYKKMACQMFCIWTVERENRIVQFCNRFGRSLTRNSASDDDIILAFDNLVGDLATINKTEDQVGRVRSRYCTAWYLLQGGSKETLELLQNEWQPKEVSDIYDEILKLIEEYDVKMADSFRYLLPNLIPAVSGKDSIYLLLEKCRKAFGGGPDNNWVSPVLWSNFWIEKPDTMRVFRERLNSVCKTNWQQVSAKVFDKTLASSVAALSEDSRFGKLELFALLEQIKGVALQVNVGMEDDEKLAATRDSFWNNTYVARPDYGGLDMLSYCQEAVGCVMSCMYVHSVLTEYMPKLPAAEKQIVLCIAADENRMGLSPTASKFELTAALLQQIRSKYFYWAEWSTIARYLHNNRSEKVKICPIIGFRAYSKLPKDRLREFKELCSAALVDALDVLRRESIKAPICYGEDFLVEQFNIQDQLEVQEPIACNGPLGLCAWREPGGNIVERREYTRYGQGGGKRAGQRRVRVSLPIAKVSVHEDGGRGRGRPGGRKSVRRRKKKRTRKLKTRRRRKS